MLESISRFGETLAHRKDVGFFYYAGHGVQIAGESYLVPVGVSKRRMRSAGEAQRPMRDPIVRQKRET